MTDTPWNAHEYHLAQTAVADLKTAIYHVLEKAHPTSLTNAEIGRSLGIYRGHVGHEGHLPRTLLGMLEDEAVVKQDSKSKRWELRNHKPAEPTAE